MAATSKEMAKIVCAALEEKKANDVKIIDISGVSVLADYFIIASGSNRNQVQAMVDSVQEDLFKKAGVEDGIIFIKAEGVKYINEKYYRKSYLKYLEDLKRKLEVEYEKHH